MDNELFIVIRHMTSDSRVIAFNTAMPQYKISQLKSKLFLVLNSQDKDTCEWWLRLYRAEFSKADIRQLERLLEEIK